MPNEDNYIMQVWQNQHVASKPPKNIKSKVSKFMVSEANV